MGAVPLQSLLSHRLRGVSERVATAVASAQAEVRKDAFVLSYGHSDGWAYRAATAARPLIAEELASLTRTPLPLHISATAGRSARRA